MAKWTVRFLEGVRDWWRWRLRRDEVHIYGIAEFRTTGTVKASESGAWRVEDAEGRLVRAVRGAEDCDINVGDRVEIEPRFQSTLRTRLNLAPNWMIVRKL